MCGIWTSGISTLRICRRICKVPNSEMCKSTFRLSQPVFRSQTMFSHLNLIVCLNNLCLHNASCENRDPCVFAGQIWHKLIFPGAVSIDHSITCKA